MRAQPMHHPRLAEIVSRYPHEGNLDLAAEMGLTVRQLLHIANIKRLLKTPATLGKVRTGGRLKFPSLKQDLQDAIAAAGAAGLDWAGIATAMSHVGAEQLRYTLNKLTAERRTHRAGRRGSSRWFGRPEEANGHETRLLLTQRPHQAAPVNVRHQPGPARLPGAPDDSAAKVTHCPGMPEPLQRWQAGAAQVFSGRIGRYDDPASSWASAVTKRGAAA